MTWDTEELLEALESCEEWGSWTCPHCGDTLEPDSPCGACDLEEPIHAAL